MKVYAQKQNQPQQQASSNFTRPSTQPLAASYVVDSILYLQRTIGNQAVQRLLHANAEALEVGSDTSAANRFAHDFSRIRASSKSSASLQTKLMVNAPGDTYEQEADSVAERVMRLPEQRLQSCCACGGGCPKCENEQATHDHLQTKHIQSNDTKETVAPPLVNEVLRSSGQPLDRTTQGFMESRFGYDFSQVRVHTNARAAASARAVHAKAYTVGRDVVFGTGQFAPETAAGRLLLAHELTHTIQQSNGMQMKSAGLIQRREISEEGPSTDDDASMSGELEPENDEEMEQEDESIDECQSPMEQSEGKPDSETGLAQVSSQLPGGNSGKPKRPGLLARIKGKLRNRRECKPFAKKKVKKPRGGTGPQKELIRCVTKYDIDRQQVGAGRQPDVRNQVTNRVFPLNESNCTYIVRWDMKSIPDQMIITDNVTGALILDTGMAAGTGQQPVQGPVNLRIRVIPNDGTLNPNNAPTVYNYDIIKICGNVKKTITCWLGVIPIGRRVEHVPFNPNANYNKKVRRVTRNGANRLLQR